MLMLCSEELIKANPYIPYPIRVSQRCLTGGLKINSRQFSKSLNVIDE